jgi:hypothetical protein
VLFCWVSTLTWEKNPFLPKKNTIQGDTRPEKNTQDLKSCRSKGQQDSSTQEACPTRTWKTSSTFYKSKQRVTRTWHWPKNPFETMGGTAKTPCKMKTTRILVRTLKWLML